MSRYVIAAVIAVLFWSSHALAAGVYVSVGGGVVFLEDSDLEQGNIAGEAEFDTGFAVNRAVGYAFDGLTLGTVRTEVDIAYRQNNVYTIRVLGVTVPAGDAEVSALSGMANVALDVATGTIGPLPKP